MDSFTYAADSAALRGDDTLIVDVPPDLADKKALFAWFAKHLAFPDYFGSNWDALDECLRDLAWIRERHLFIAHHKLPLSDQKSDQKTYLEMLEGVVRSWECDHTHNVVVIFDPACESQIHALTAVACDDVRQPWRQRR